MRYSSFVSTRKDYCNFPCRVGVDEWLRVPSVEDVFAIGDCAGFLEQTGRPILPALAQVCILLASSSSFLFQAVKPSKCAYLDKLYSRSSWTVIKCFSLLGMLSALCNLVIGQVAER